MHRFFTPQSDLATRPSITLTAPDEIHHLKHVLRLKVGDHGILFNESGEEALCEISTIKATEVEFKILSCANTEGRKTHRIILACAIPKKGKFESVIEKTTELGVDEIIPLMTERTEVRLKGDQLLRKTDRYRKVAINASKQCRRRSVPEIQLPAGFETVLKNNPSEKTLLVLPCLTGERRGILSALKKNADGKNILILIGPEGDFTDTEVKQALAAGAIAVSLGPTVLKVDTAAMSAVAAVRFLQERALTT